jgi:hypothetical protein
MAPGEHDHQHVFGNRGLVAIGVADRDPARQGGLLDPFDAGRNRLHERDPRRRWIIGAPDIRDENVCRRSRFGGQLFRIGDDLDLELRRQFGPDAVRGIGGDIAEEQRSHGSPFPSALNSARRHAAIFRRG